MSEERAAAPRLLLIDTVDQLPGLLPLHAYDALRSSDLIVVGGDEHPLLPSLRMADERVELVPQDLGQKALVRTELLGGLSTADKARAGWIVDRTAEVGALAYVLGPADTDAFTRTLGMEAARAELEVEVVYFGLAPKGVKVLELAHVQERLLGPDGCPWDAEQTHESLAKFAIEEAHELADAIAAGDVDHIREELGDVLMQVVFHAEIAESFGLDDVAAGIAAKLVRRHPHVFADGQADTPQAVEASWEALKAAEKPERDGPFDGIPSGLPAIAGAAAVQSRAERLGFSWRDPIEAAEQVAEELAEVLDADGADAAARRREIGDLLFAAVSLARASGIDPDDALRSATARFRSRFEDVLAQVALDRVDLGELTADSWRRRWSRAKNETDPLM